MGVDAPRRDGKQFFFPGDGPIHGLADVLRWKFTSKAQPWPTPDPVMPGPPPARPSTGMTVTWIGHASFLVQTPTQAFLIDPVFSPRASPFSRIGPKRAVAPGLDYLRLPKIDAVLLSHDHYDHCDLASLTAIARDHASVLISPLGYRPLLGKLGFNEHVELNWWMPYAAAEWSLTFVPSRHWCRRLPWDTNTRLWGGFFVMAAGKSLYFVGDSGYHPTLFKEIGQRCGAPDLALIPIGAYAPRWFMADAHMDPVGSVQVHLDVAARHSIGMHWGTFQLTDEPRMEPVELLAAACAENHLDHGEFGVLEPGGSLKV